MSRFYCPACSMRLNEHDDECCFPGCSLNPDNNIDRDNHRNISVPNSWYDSKLWEMKRGSERYRKVKESLIKS